MANLCTNGVTLQVRSDWHKKWDDPNFASLAPFPGVGLEALQLLHLQRGILFHGEGQPCESADGSTCDPSHRVCYVLPIIHNAIHILWYKWMYSHCQCLNLKAM